MVNPDFSTKARSSLLDGVYWYAMSVAPLATSDIAFPQPIRKDAIGILVTSNANMWLDLNGNAQAAGNGPNAIFVASGLVLEVGLELDADLVPHVFNPNAGQGGVSIVVLKRRRSVERLAGQV